MAGTEASLPAVTRFQLQPVVLCCVMFPLSLSMLVSVFSCPVSQVENRPELPESLK